jgi:hypothetical protein
MIEGTKNGRNNIKETGLFKCKYYRRFIIIIIFTFFFFKL